MQTFIWQDRVSPLRPNPLVFQFSRKSPKSSILTGRNTQRKTKINCFVGIQSQRKPIIYGSRSRFPGRRERRTSRLHSLGVDEEALTQVYTKFLGDQAFLVLISALFGALLSSMVPAIHKAAKWLRMPEDEEDEMEDKAGWTPSWQRTLTPPPVPASDVTSLLTQPPVVAAPAPSPLLSSSNTTAAAASTSKQALQSRRAAQNVDTNTTARTSKELWDHATLLASSPSPDSKHVLAPPGGSTPQNGLKALRASGKQAERRVQNTLNRGGGGGVQAGGTKKAKLKNKTGLQAPQMYLQGLTPQAELSLLRAAAQALRQVVDQQPQDNLPKPLDVKTTQQILTRAARKTLCLWLDPEEAFVRASDSLTGEKETSPTTSSTVPSSSSKLGSNVNSTLKEWGGKREEETPAGAVVSEYSSQAEAEEDVLDQMVDAASEHLGGLPQSRLNLHSSLLTYLSEWGQEAEEDGGGSSWHEKQLEGSSQAGAVGAGVIGSTVAEALLQDCVVGVAEACAEAYMSSLRSRKEARPTPANTTTSGLLAAHTSPTWLRSTRSLEKFRNSVALARWVEWHTGDVVAIMEDRYPLLGFAPDGSLIRRQLPVCRQDELDALDGWRRSFNVILEMADVIIPFMSGLFSYIGDGVSWILVRLIGRSLGLIYRGVRQSLAPQN